MEEKKAGAYSYGKLLKQPGLFNRLECYGPDMILREGIKKKSIYIGKSPKQRTPPIHRYSLGLT